MAWVVTDRGNDTENGNSTNLSIGPFTPTADSLLLLILFHTSDGAPYTPSGQDDGTAWVQLLNAYGIGTEEKYVSVWGCFTGSSPSSGSVTVSKTAYAWRCGGLIVEVDENVSGVDISGTIANAIGTIDTDSGYNVDLSLTLPAFADSGNLTFAAYAVLDSNTNDKYSFPSTPTWTEGPESISAFNYSIDTGYYAGEDTSITLARADYYYTVGGIAFEVKAAGGSIGTVCWGDDNPDEEYIRDFTGNITEGSGYRILGSGDLERVELEAGGYIEIETWNLGVMRCSITTDKYESGSGSLAIKYKDGVDQSACEADSWNVYTGAFDCTGWIKVRVEAS